MEKKPLYRKINKKTHNGWAWNEFPKARYRFERGKKRDHLPEHQSIKRKNQFSSWGSGYDYTPLFKFLHAHVGQAWNPVFQECISRLDKPAPITWMVVNVNERGLVVDRHPNEELSPFVRCGNESYWSALWVDEDAILQYVDKDFTIEGTWLEKLTEYYSGEWTVTWNGKVVWQGRVVGAGAGMQDTADSLPKEETGGHK